MATSKSPFAIADRYIQLRKQYAPQSWGDTMLRLNDLVLGPLLTLVFLCFESFDLLSLISSVLSTFRAWTEWTEFWSLRFQMQNMYLITMKTGGPQIVTNDATYLPYVYADAVVRHGMRHRGSAPVRRSAEPSRHRP